MSLSFEEKAKIWKQRIVQNKTLTYYVQLGSSFLIFYLGFLLQSSTRSNDDQFLLFWIQAQFFSEAIGQFILAMSSYSSPSAELVYFERNIWGKIAWVMFSVTSISRVSVALLVLPYQTVPRDYLNSFSIILFSIILMSYIYSSQSDDLSAFYHSFPSVVFEMIAFFLRFARDQEVIFPFLAGLSQLVYLSFFVLVFQVPSWNLEIINCFVWLLLFYSV